MNMEKERAERIDALAYLVGASGRLMRRMVEQESALGVRVLSCSLSRARAAAAPRVSPEILAVAEQAERDVAVFCLSGSEAARKYAHQSVNTLRVAALEAQKRA